MILFFIRRYNDIDHIVPIVYRFVKDGHNNVRVLCLHMDYEIHNDWRLNYLINMHNVIVDYAYKYFKSGFYQTVLIAITTIALKFNASWIFRKIYCSRIWNKAFNEKWMQKEIINVKPSIMVFDWHQQKLQLVKDLISVAKKNNIKIIGVPHGGHPFTNKLWTNKMFDNNETFPFGQYWAAFDQVILQDYNHSKFVKLGGFPEKNINVIGNARLCTEWIHENAKLNKSLKNIVLPTKNNNLLNVLYLDHSPAYRIRKKEIINGLNALGNLDFIKLFIKPTVSVQNKRFPKKSSIENAATSIGLTNVNYLTEVPTHLLINWADVVIGLTTSALFEAVMMGKHLIIPKYFHDNSTIYEEYNVCWLASNDRELIDIVKSIYKRPDYYPYGDKERENFMTDIIYGGKKERDVLGEYKDFILKETQLN